MTWALAPLSPREGLCVKVRRYISAAEGILREQDGSQALLPSPHPLAPVSPVLGRLADNFAMPLLR